jgi:hypothetical protein
MRAADPRFAHRRFVHPHFVLTLVAVTCVSSCTANRAPREWRPPVVVAQRSSHGGWITIEVVKTPGAKSSDGPITEGELIAIDETAFHVLSAAGLESVPRASVRRITIVGYGNRAGTLAAWSVAGGISSLSHGGFLLLTAPMWAIGGIAASLTEKHAGTWHDDDVARRFARFPQGLPPGFDSKSLGPLPVAGRLSGR